MRGAQAGIGTAAGHSTDGSDDARAGTADADELAGGVAGGSGTGGVDAICGATRAAAAAAAGAGGTVGAITGGSLAAVGVVSTGGVVLAGGVVVAGGTVFAMAGGVLAAGGRVFSSCPGAVDDGLTGGADTASNESGQLSIASPSGIVSGSGRSSWMVEEGGQAGIVCSVGGSGGQMSVAAGMTSGGGAASLIETAGGGAASLIETAGGGAAIPLSPCAGVEDSSSGAGTVWAQVGVGFCMGTACFGSVPESGSASGSLGRVSVCAHSGSLVFCIGSAGKGSASEAVSVAD